MPTAKLLLSEKRGEWEYHYREALDELGQYQCTYVDMFRGLQGKARITVVRQGVDAAVVLEHLRSKANAWIDEYEAREHDGSTGFADL